MRMSEISVGGLADRAREPTRDPAEALTRPGDLADAERALGGTIGEGDQTQ